jgi:hypothetical protein
MSAPIPLAAPDGTVYAYACGTCHNTFATSYQRPRADVARLAAGYLRAAERCCMCDCGAPADPTQWARTCAACAAREAAERGARAEARAADLAARGMQECAVCDGTGSLDLDDVDCDACGGTGEVPL